MTQVTVKPVYCSDCKRGAAKARKAEPCVVEEQPKEVISWLQKELSSSSSSLSSLTSVRSVLMSLLAGPVCDWEQPSVTKQNRNGCLNLAVGQWQAGQTLKEDNMFTWKGQLLNFIKSHPDQLVL
ncbi:hypothetical protein EYF80_009228 [Liparis tanakae]|uniref:Uncharacterized protein n=1 Tax=Liparis tanakae TaxID=230148 RepID=A0A4Z2IR77_9TELE|nr:hypothetical protein EYF80_009228 [Liparis tanakae]